MARDPRWGRRQGTLREPEAIHVDTDDNLKLFFSDSEYISFDPITLAFHLC